MADPDGHAQDAREAAIMDALVPLSKAFDAILDAVIWGDGECDIPMKVVDAQRSAIADGVTRMRKAWGCDQAVLGVLSFKCRVAHPEQAHDAGLGMLLGILREVGTDDCLELITEVPTGLQAAKADLRAISAVLELMAFGDRQEAIDAFEAALMSGEDKEVFVALEKVHRGDGNDG